MSEEAESGFFGSFTCLTKISVTPPSDSPNTSNSPSTSTSDNSVGVIGHNGFLQPVPLYRQNLNSYTRKKARREKYLKDMLMHKVVSKSNIANMMSALLQLSGRNANILDQSLLELWHQVNLIMYEFWTTF